LIFIISRDLGRHLFSSRGDFMKNTGTPRINLITHSKIDSTYWLRRAEMTHNKVADTHDPKLKERLRRIALEYERLATDSSGRVPVTSSSALSDQHRPSQPNIDRRHPLSIAKTEQQPACGLPSALPINFDRRKNGVRDQGLP